MSIARLCACTVMGSSDCIGARQLLIQISTMHIQSSGHAVFYVAEGCRGHMLFVFFMQFISIAQALLGAYSRWSAGSS